MYKAMRQLFAVILLLGAAQQSAYGQGGYCAVEPWDDQLSDALASSPETYPDLRDAIEARNPGTINMRVVKDASRVVGSGARVGSLMLFDGEYPPTEGLYKVLLAECDLPSGSKDWKCDQVHPLTYLQYNGIQVLVAGLGGQEAGKILEGFSQLTVKHIITSRSLAISRSARMHSIRTTIQSRAGYLGWTRPSKHAHLQVD